MDGSGQTEGGKGGGAVRDMSLALGTVLDGLPDAVVAATRDSRIVFVNSLAEQLFGYPRGELIGQPVAVLWPESVRALYVSNMERYFELDRPMRFTSEAHGLRRDGSQFVGEMSWGVVETTAGRVLLAIGRDISDRLANEARLRAVASLAESALTGTDARQVCAEAIDALTTTLPIAAAEIHLAGGETVRSGAAAQAPLILGLGDAGELAVATRRELTRDERSAAGAIGNVLATALARLRTEERMRYDAMHDPLTGLANRSLLRDRLEHALARSAREGIPTGVLFIDLDNFKQINDVHGHAAGDTVLIEIARRLHAAMRPSDTVARLGGDEFVAVCEAITPNLALTLARRLRDEIRQPLSAGDTVHRLSASIGIALGVAELEKLMAAADAAVYRAKAQGGGHVELSQ